ncbi:hypothetical protein [Ornithinimicrobium sp. CNJ-824]|uniref:hypothetical protein n=1 Tax=Ornithinimicrobium sp. CNJ-824 TaxID=1904966 RepID=UPI00192CFEE9|nr:hypothetical protein [Ornithinimicrobium sp. CNJ-824]
MTESSRRGVMSSIEYSFPVAVSQLGDQDSRETQNRRAISWLLKQSGGSIVVVTPRRQIPEESLRRLVSRHDATHLTWRGLAVESLAHRRVLHAWPDRQHLNDLWGVDCDALVVIEWNVAETETWVEDARATRLLPGGELRPSLGVVEEQSVDVLPNGVGEILEHLAAWAAGYDSGLKWNEEDKLKADMMNRPERWAPVTVEQVRTKCRA